MGWFKYCLAGLLLFVLYKAAIYAAETDMASLLVIVLCLVVLVSFFLGGDKKK